MCWSLWVAMSWRVSSIFKPEKRVLLSQCPTLLWGFNGLVGKGHRHPRPGKCRVAKNREEPKSRKVLKVAASSLIMCFFIFFLLLPLGAAFGASLIAPGGSVRLFQARDPEKSWSTFFCLWKSVEGAKEEAMRSDWEKLNSCKFM